MKRFELRPKIYELESFSEFSREFLLSRDDLIFTHRFLYDDYMAPLNLSCSVLFCEDYGGGEPSDKMVDAIFADLKKTSFNRIVAVGGGTVLDIAKLLSIKGASSVAQIFDDKIELKRENGLVLVPTTCGTGSEMTCVSVVDFSEQKAKLGKRIEANFADAAVLIPELLQKLPYTPFSHSAIDALIHAMEIYVAPFVSSFSQVFCRRAMELLLDGFEVIKRDGPHGRHQLMGRFLLASSFSGVALSNTVCGAVHACAMQLGSVHHTSHGLSNYIFLIGVFRAYVKKGRGGAMGEVCDIIRERLKIEGDDGAALDALEELLSHISPKKRLRDLGIEEGRLPWYVERVVATQQRLLINSCYSLSQEELLDIYRAIY